MGGHSPPSKPPTPARLSISIMSDPESSPDPLALSVNRAPSARKPLRHTSDNPFTGDSRYARRNGSYTRESGFFEVSPSKSVVMHTPKTTGSSPWKIKVTVEPHQACEHSDQENTTLESPSRRVLQRTTTTTVPLKGAEEHSPIKRRGRRRKSESTTTAKLKRDGMPVKKTSKARASTSKDYRDTQGESMTMSVPQKKRRGRPRKSSAQDEATEAAPASNGTNKTSGFKAGTSPTIGHRTEPVDGNAIAAASLHQVYAEETSKLLGATEDATQSSVEQAAESLLHTNFNNDTSEALVALGEQSHTLPTKRGPGRPRKNEKPSQTRNAPSTKETYAKPTTIPPTRVIDFASLTPLHLKYPSQSDANGSPELINPLHYRVPTPRKPVGWSEDKLSPLPDDSPLNTESFSPVNLVGGQGSKPARQLVDPIQRSLFSTSSRNVAPNQAFGSPLIENENTVPTTAASGPEELLDNTTILESEGFSMVSIDSLSSHRVSSSPAGSQSGNTIIPFEGQRHGAHGPQLLSKSTDSEGEILQDTEMRAIQGDHVQTSRPMPDRSDRTPSLQITSPSEPPPIGVPPLYVSDTSTLKLSRVVKAGIALQGVVEVKSNRTLGSRSPVAIRSRLDNLFSGFEEGTRRELQAGLRLGEELARRSQERSLSRESSPIVNSTPASTSVGDDVFKTESNASKNYLNSQRLPTPDDVSDTYAPNSAACSITYALPVPPSLLGDRVKYSSLSKHVERQQLVTPEATSDMDWKAATPPSTGESNEAFNDSTRLPPDLEEQDAVSDIWEEEASRSSNGHWATANMDHSDDGRTALQETTSTDPSLLKPKRSKLPKTWRRKSTNDFDYSDEPEPKLQQDEVEEYIHRHPGSTRDDVVNTVEDASNESQDDHTGLFWRHNLPALALKSKSRDSRGQSQKLDLSELLGIHNNPVESSPFHLSSRLRPYENPLPIFKPSYNDSPPKQLAFASSPPKQVSFADIKFDETIDDSGISNGACSETSDVQQLHAEMGLHREKAPADLESEVVEDSTDKSLSLDEWPTAPRTSHSVLNISLSKNPHPLFATSAHAAPTLEVTPSTKGSPADSAPAGHGLISRLTGGIWSAFTAPPPPSRHAILKKYPPIPYLFPWTRTHFISLDNLLQAHKRDPTIFSPKTHPNNAALLSSFANHSKYVGTVYSNWGYSVTMTEEYLVMAKVLMQTMTVKDGAEYEKTTGKKIKVGDCNGRNGKDGVRINEDDVVMRIFAVVSGEMMREDERQGKEINREGVLQIEWSK